MNGTSALNIKEPDTYFVSYRWQNSDPARIINQTVEDATKTNNHGSMGKLTNPEAISSDSGLKILNLPTFKRVAATMGEFFAATQEWEGYVTAVYDDYFTANLRDVTANEDEISEIAEIPIDSLSKDDQPKLTEGLIFRWLIGYSKTKSRQHSKKQIIYIRSGVAKSDSHIKLSDVNASLRNRFKELPKIDI